MPTLPSLLTLQALAKQATVLTFRDEQGVIQNINPTIVLALLERLERMEEALHKLQEMAKETGLQGDKLLCLSGQVRVIAREALAPLGGTYES